MANTPMFGLKPATIQKITAVFAQHPDIETAILYGSRAKGTYRNGSDIDLTLQGDQLKTTTLYQVERELDDLLLPYTIDISLYREIGNPNLLEHIRRLGVVFYQRQPD